MQSFDQFLKDEDIIRIILNIAREEKERKKNDNKDEPATPVKSLKNDVQSKIAS